MKLREDLVDLVPYTAGKLKPGALKLASNENPLGPSPLALTAVREALCGVHIYPDGAMVGLKKALASEWSLEPDRFAVGNGSDEVLTLIAGAYIHPGDNGVTAAHTFSEYQFAVRLFGGTMRKAPLKDYVIDLDAFLGLSDNRTRVVFLCNPNNPTATWFSDSALRAFLDRLPSDVLVVLDEAYAHFAEDPGFPDARALLADYPNLLVLRTFSKAYGLAAMRVGYAIASPEVIRDLSVVRQPFNVGTLSQIAATAALGDRDFLERSIAVNREGRLYLDEELTKRGFRVLPSQANFLAVHVRTDAQRVFQLVMDEGVTIRPLGSFGMPDWVRITVGTQEQNRFFLQAWDRASAKF